MLMPETVTVLYFAVLMIQSPKAVVSLSKRMSLAAGRSGLVVEVDDQRFGFGKMRNLSEMTLRQCQRGLLALKASMGYNLLRWFTIVVIGMPIDRMSAHFQKLRGQAAWKSCSSSESPQSHRPVSGKAKGALRSDRSYFRPVNYYSRD